MRRTLALFFPTFAVDRVRRLNMASGMRTPLLLVTTERGSRKVASGSPEACVRGVEPGMSLAHARALLGEGAGPVEIEEHDPASDLHALERLGAWAMRFSPIVAADPPDGLLLDITGSRRLFGEEEPLMERVARDCEGLGYRVRAAIADTIGCAWAVSRFGRRALATVAPGAETVALAPLLIAALRVEPETVDGLFEVGIERIGQLLEVRRDELPARFRGDLLLRLDQALGNAFEPCEPIRHVFPLRAAHVFEEPVGLGVGLAVMDELLGRLTRELHRREEGVRRVEVEWLCAQSPAILETIALTRPSRELRHLQALLEPRFERAQLGFGVERITLDMPETSPVSMRQVESWVGSKTRAKARTDGSARMDPLGDQALGELLDSLISRLGPARIRRIQSVESHLPESAFRSRACYDLARRTDEGARITPLARPSRFFSPPHPIAVDDHEGRPVRFCWSGHAYDVVRSFGPERIEAPWWRDDVCVARDYFRIEDEVGRWLWIARELGGGRWCVYGEWA